MYKRQELITASVTQGIPHPPGYPVYLLLGKVISSIPIGSVAYRFNLLSALSLAAAAGFLSATVRNLSSKHLSDRRVNPVVAVASGLVLAFIPLVWGQALIAEVYTLNLAFLSVLFWLLTRNLENKTAIAAGLFFGLSITSHLTSLFMLPLCLYLLPRRYWPRFALGATIGILPFLVLPAMASTSSPVKWGSTDTISGWLRFVTAQIYKPNVLSLPQGQWMLRISEWGSLFLKQYAWYGIPLIFLGLIAANTKGKQLMAVFIGTAAIFVLYAFGYRSNDALVFMLPGIFLLVLSLGFGMKSLGKTSLLLPGLLLALNFGGQYLGDDYGVRRAAELAFQNLPTSSIVLTPGDQSATTLLYYQQVEAYRPDVIVVDDTMFQFNWYRESLRSQHPSLTHLDQDDVPGFIENNIQNRPICYVALVIQPGVECLDTSKFVLADEH